MNQYIDIYLGRQPIFNRKMNVIGYELLFRGDAHNNSAQILGGDTASAEVMMNAFGEFGIKDLVGRHRGFINFTEGLLLRENQSFFPKDKVVIEVLEDVKVTPVLIESLEKLKQKGFLIALDDYVFNPELLPLERFADIIKVEIHEVGPKQLIEHSKRLRAQGIKLLAEKVETREQFEYCAKLGFDYFQGYFFAKPQIIAGRRLPTAKLTVLELLSNVYDPEVDMHKLSDIVGRDVALSQKLLKFVADTGSENVHIHSIHDAVLRFGLNRLKSWASMLVLAGVDDKPLELLKTSLLHAKFCELYGEKVSRHAKESFFTVGLFSCLDAVMDTEMKTLLEKLHLDESICKALLAEQGELGLALKTVRAMEQGQTGFDLPQGLTPNMLSEMYVQSMHFAESIKLG
ncbi:EAL and HDOD domain-containing protein [Thiomicrorhabdus sediminis]|uniref:EAL domain-containing protein n=1 Tax=Thiomicrorhabdus sediminis TaxID=2580412 RepID=A0A4P9K7Q5_9GAMM|nr:EAL domain-containing protein [Thiomicrorhabdus sediminis]QCU90961.1 EAL domain-containing protein [Thiomicrorhabdus sediminis]